MKTGRKIVIFFLLFFLSFPLFLLFLAGSGALNTPKAKASTVKGVRYVEHWSQGDAYTHDLLVQRYGITAEQLDGFLDTLGVPYDKSRINGTKLLEWQSASGLDVRGIVAIALLESSLGTAGVATMPGANMFGYGAFDTSPENATSFNDETAVVQLTKVTIIQNKNTSFKIQDDKAQKNANGTLNPAVDGGVYFTDTSGSGRRRADVMERLDKWIDEHGGTPPPPAESASPIGNGEYAHIFDSEYQVLQPYGFTPWSIGAGASLYASSGGKHTGVDVATTNAGDGKDIAVYSITDGTVYSVSYSDLGGHAITIQPEGTNDYLYYGHLKYAPTLQSGQVVKKGDQIAVLGHSGLTDIYHVHLEYSTSPSMGTGQFDKDPSFLFQKEGTLAQNQIIRP